MLVSCLQQKSMLPPHCQQTVSEAIFSEALPRHCSGIAPSETVIDTFVVSHLLTLSHQATMVVSIVVQHDRAETILSRSSFLVCLTQVVNGQSLGLGNRARLMKPGAATTRFGASSNSRRLEVVRGQRGGKSNHLHRQSGGPAKSASHQARLIEKRDHEDRPGRLLNAEAARGYLMARLRRVLPRLLIHQPEYSTSEAGYSVTSGRLSSYPTSCAILHSSKGIAFSPMSLTGETYQPSQSNVEGM